MNTKNEEAPKGYEIPELAKPRIRQTPPAVEVVIKGEPGSGKSEILKIIAEALEAKGLQAVYHMGGAGAPQIIPAPPSASHDERLIKVVEEWGTMSEPSDASKVVAPSVGLSVAEWLLERENNAREIAASKAGEDARGWLEDAAYYRSARIQLTDTKPNFRCEKCHKSARELDSGNWLHRINPGETPSVWMCDICINLP